MDEKYHQRAAAALKFQKDAYGKISDDEFEIGDYQERTIGRSMGG